MAKFVRPAKANIPPLLLECYRSQYDFAWIIRKRRGRRKILSETGNEYDCGGTRPIYKNLDNGWFDIKESALAKPSNHHGCRNNVYLYS
ncbi:hypothetical protein J3E69DRAFT_369919 [Trichoderma sp. SZMC 28015]